MCRAQPGDLIVSYAAGEIRYVGMVADVAITAPKPQEFGTTGEYWSDEGWLLPMKWTSLQPPTRPKGMINELRPMLPAKYSPINPATGNGNQKAYLAEISQAVFDLLIASSEFDMNELTADSRPS
jgi:hypothetical protein